MNAHHKNTGATHRLIEPQPFRLRAELPALTQAPAYATMHDFLVPNLRPDLAAGREDAPRTEHQTAPRRYIEPDSMFWSPETAAGDAA